MGENLPKPHVVTSHGQLSLIWTRTLHAFMWRNWLGAMLLIGGIALLTLCVLHWPYIHLSAAPLVLSFCVISSLFFMVLRAKDTSIAGGPAGAEHEASAKAAQDLLLDLVVSLVTGVALSSAVFTSLQPEPQSATVSGPNDAVTVSAPTQDALSAIVPGLITGAILFLMQALARSLSTMVRTKEQLDRLDGITKKANAAFTQAEYAALAAEALALDSNDFQSAIGEVDAQAADTLRLGLDNLTAAGKSIANIRLAGRRTVPNAVWWRFLRSYFQEEMYDISNFELATNVRNYAFAILSIANEFRVQLKKSGKRLVVINVSPFNPKDFYNWPHRVGSQSVSYHEAEFFSVYRRAYSKLIRSENITPLRILVTSNLEGIYRREDPDTRRRELGLGWRLDTTPHVVDSLARYRFCPFPVFAACPGDGGSRHTDTNCDDPQVRSLATHYSSEAARHVDRMTSRIMVTPFDRCRNGTPIEDGLPGDRTALFNSIKNGTLTRIAGGRRDVLLRECKDTWISALRAVDTLLPGVSEAFSDLDGIQGISDQQRERLYSQGHVAGIARKYADSLLQTIADLAPRAAQILRDDWAGNDDGGVVCEILDRAQAADAKVRFLQAYSGNAVTSTGTRSSFGAEMGAFEEWSLFYCVYAYFLRCSDSMGTSDPIPLWRLFFRDMLALNGVEDFASLRKQVQPRMRVWELHQKEDVIALHNDGITSEFALYCEAEGTWTPEDGLDSVSPLLLLSATLSEPFHTCRLRLRTPGATPGGPLEKHWKKVKEVFANDGSVTNEMLDKVQEGVSYS